MNDTPYGEGEKKRFRLLDQASCKRLPPLYSQEDKGLDALAQVKFFTPDSGWTWWASEASAVLEDGTEISLAEVKLTDPRVKDVLFFGLVEGLETELGYFSLCELETVRGKLRLSVERDRYFRPVPLKQLG